MPRERRESPLSEDARGLRVATHVVAFLTFVLFCGTLAAFKGKIPAILAGPLLTLFVASTLSAIWLGVKAHRKALEDRTRESGRAMVIAIAVQLAKQDSTSLEAIKAKGGPAGEAAGMILKGRAEKESKVRSKE